METELNTVNREYITWQYQELNFALLGGLKIEGLDRMRLTIKVEYEKQAIRHNPFLVLFCEFVFNKISFFLVCQLLNIVYLFSCI